MIDTSLLLSIIEVLKRTDIIKVSHKQEQIDEKN